jgi:hypothetical protein
MASGRPASRLVRLRSLLSVEGELRARVLTVERIGWFAIVALRTGLLGKESTVGIVLQINRP